MGSLLLCNSPLSHVPHPELSDHSSSTLTTCFQHFHPLDVSRRSVQALRGPLSMPLDQPPVSQNQDIQSEDTDKHPPKSSSPHVT